MSEEQSNKIKAALAKLGNGVNKSILNSREESPDALVDTEVEVRPTTHGLYDLYTIRYADNSFHSRLHAFNMIRGLLAHKLIRVVNDPFHRDIRALEEEFAKALSGLTPEMRFTNLVEGVRVSGVINQKSKKMEFTFPLTTTSIDTLRRLNEAAAEAPQKPVMVHDIYARAEHKPLLPPSHEYSDEESADSLQKIADIIATHLGNEEGGMTVGSKSARSPLQLMDDNTHKVYVLHYKKAAADACIHASNLVATLVRAKLMILPDTAKGASDPIANVLLRLEPGKSRHITPDLEVRLDSNGEMDLAIRLGKPLLGMFWENAFEFAQKERPLIGNVAEKWLDKVETDSAFFARDYLVWKIKKTLPELGEPITHDSYNRKTRPKTALITLSLDCPKAMDKNEVCDRIDAALKPVFGNIVQYVLVPHSSRIQVIVSGYPSRLADCIKEKEPDPTFLTQAKARLRMVGSEGNAEQQR